MDSTNATLAKIKRGLWLVQFYCKNTENFLNAMQKVSPENSIALPRNRKKNGRVSLTYDVNEHVYSKSKYI